MNKFLALLLLLGVFGFMPNALTEDAPTIDASSQVRLPLAGPNFELLTLRVNNIQVRAEWDVIGNDSADFSVDGGTLVLVPEVTSPTIKSAVVVVRDKFSDLNSSYTDLEAKATINIAFVTEKIFILGGQKVPDSTNDADYLNDVWVSENGLTWQHLGTADWVGRTEHAAVSHNGKIFIMGGRNGNTTYNDVWSSANGSSWANLGNAKWSLRYGLQAVSYNGKIYVSGGNNGGDEVWSSADGIDWTPLSGTKFLARRYHQMGVFGDKMLVFGGVGQGGGFRNDVWSSNGGGWSRDTASAGWSVRRGFEVVLHSGAMYLMGGFNGVSDFYKDVWKGTSSSSWNEETISGASWEGRFGLGAASFKNHIYVFGGANASTVFNDAWRSGDGISWGTLTAPGWPARYGHQVLVHGTLD